MSLYNSDIYCKYCNVHSFIICKTVSWCLFLAISRDVIKAIGYRFNENLLFFKYQSSTFANLPHCYGKMISVQYSRECSVKSNGKKLWAKLWKQTFTEVDDICKSDTICKFLAPVEQHQISHRIEVYKYQQVS